MKILCVLLVIIHCVFARRCYVCSGSFRGGPSCFSNKLTEDQLQECPDDEDYCMSSIATREPWNAESVTRIERSCSRSNREANNAGSSPMRFTRSCNQDGCNTHGPIIPEEPEAPAPVVQNCEREAESKVETEVTSPDTGTDTGGAAAMKSASVLILTVTSALACKIFM